jgi:hypothetical protein
MEDSPMERFWCKVNKNGPTMPHMNTPCWVWARQIGHNGYGVFKFDLKSQKAHRVAFFLHYGRWPQPQALHHCDNPACVRWDHLFEGTQKDNINDAKEKGRMVGGSGNGMGTSLPGEQNGRAKLTETQVKALRDRRIAGDSYRKLSETFLISKTQAIAIVKGTRWSHSLAA